MLAFLAAPLLLALAAANPVAEPQANRPKCLKTATLTLGNPGCPPVPVPTSTILCNLPECAYPEPTTTVTPTCPCSSQVTKTAFETCAPTTQTCPSCPTATATAKTYCGE